jgi:molybdate transport system substrate-binding protein
MDYPRQLVETGFGLETNVFPYAAGRVVVWMPTNSAVNVEQLGIRALLAPSVRKVAIANPRHAPYGVAAMEAMKAFQVYEQVKPKLVLGENVAQTAQFVQSGNADAGIIALALALSPQMREVGRYWEIPPDEYARIEQGGLILKRAKEPVAARTFRDFMLGEQARVILKRYGYFLPEK